MLVRRASAIALTLGVGAGLGGCNQVFGLDAPRALDAADDGDGDAGDAVDASVDGRPSGATSAVFASSVDYVSPLGAVRGYEALASFGPIEDCTLVVSAGGCRVERCVPRMAAEPAPASGTVTIEGNARLVDLVPDVVTGRYEPQTGTDGVLYDPGILVGVYSTGGVVPAFAVNQVSPGIIRFSEPLFPSPTAPATAVRSADMAVAWEPPVSGEVILVITDAAGARLTCQFPATSGQDTIPAAALRELAPGPGSLLTYSMVTAVVTAGTFDVAVGVAQAARRKDNDAARGTLTLQ